MATQPGENEGFRMLDDLVCEAQPAGEVAASGSVGRGANRGARVLAEVVVSTAPPPEERPSERRTQTNSELLALVRFRAAELTPEDFRIIHEIAIERLTNSSGPFSAGAAELSRAVLQAALGRIA